MKQFELNKFLPLEVDDNILENNPCARNRIY